MKPHIQINPATFDKSSYPNYLNNLNFFEWLFQVEGEKSPISSDIDLSLCRNFDDPNIYYSDEVIGEILQTNAMKRIFRIMQLASFINTNKYTTHSRAEHSLGVYNQKKIILQNLYENNPDFKRKVEENHLQVYLIAELLKSLLHDIGHLPQSHIIEIECIEFKGFHEILGNKILLDDSQIQEIFDGYDENHPNNPIKLKDAIKELISHDEINFKDLFNFDKSPNNTTESFYEHSNSISQNHYNYIFSLIDEGNYDIDRFDYIIRDFFHRGKLNSLKYTNSNGELVNLESFEQPTMELVNYKGQEIYVPVFDVKSVPSIEAFLNLRLQTYKEAYFSPDNKIRDSLVSKCINRLIDSNSANAIDLKNFILNLKQLGKKYKDTR